MTAILFEIPETSHVMFKIYSDGRLVETLIDNVLQKGFHEVIWNGTSQNGVTVASGVYLYCIRMK